MNYWHSFEENNFYHIYNRSNNKEAIFLHEDNYRFFLTLWDKYLSSYLDTFSYALIPNHFHFTVRVRKINIQLIDSAKSEKTVAGAKFSIGDVTLDMFIEDQMKRFLTSYAKAFNKQQQREGSVFQKRFKRIAIRHENHLCYLIAYHHHNPIHHGLVQDFVQWKYSSYRTILSDAPSKVCREEVLNLFFEGDRQKSLEVFTQYHLNFKLDKAQAYLIWEE